MNVLPECFSCLTIDKRARVRVRVRVRERERERAGSGRDGGWGEREYVSM